MPIPLRIALLELKKKAKDAADNAKLVNDMIASIAKSQNIDPDPDAGKRFKVRRQYLKELKAITV
jgi:hypothetical protein